MLAYIRRHFALATKDGCMFVAMYFTLNVLLGMNDTILYFIVIKP